MRKKKTKAQQEHDKQLRRLKSIVRRAEKAGLIFDTSPIPEKATTKRLSKITGADIRKQGYRFTTEGAKDYYTPYKERQRGVQKAKETIAQKRTDPAYNKMYIAERQMAHKARKQKESGRRLSAATKDVQTARALRDSLVSAGDKDYTKQVLSDWYSRVVAKDPEAGKDFAKMWGLKLDENGVPIFRDFPREEYEKRVQQRTEDVELAQRRYNEARTIDNAKVDDLMKASKSYTAAKTLYEESVENEAEYDSDYYQEYDPRYDTLFDRALSKFNPNDYNYRYAFSPEGLEARWTEEYREEFNRGISRRIADSDYEQYHNVVFDPLTGAPVARFDPETSSFIPFEYRQDELYGSRKTGEVYGTFVDMFSYEILDKLESGVYTSEGDYILDEHGQPIATLETVYKLNDSTQMYDRRGIKLVPYNPPIFKDISDYNLNDYISSFSPNMESALREFYEDIEDDEDEIEELGDRLQNVHYAYERVINYSSYEELITGYYEMAEAIKGEPLTDEERAKLEQAVDDDRKKRTRRKKKRTKKK